MQRSARDPIGRPVLLLVGALALLAIAGCMGNPIPLSAQAGSTIVVPYSSSDFDVFEFVDPVGFGGTEVEDPQRGTLVLQLDSFGGFELTTRLGLNAAAPVEAPVGAGAAGWGSQLLLVVDIPTDAPLGTHDLVLVNRRVEGGVPVDTQITPSPGAIRILPTVVDAGGELVTGAATPGQFFSPGAGFLPLKDFVDLDGDGELDNFFENAVPEPSFGVQVSTPTGQVPPGSAPRLIAYASVDVTYPAGVIDIERVVATYPNDGLVWFEDDQLGNLTVYGLSLKKRGATGLGPFRVVFSLDDPDAALLDLASVGATLDTARDQFGDASIVGDWGLLATTTRIR